MAAPRLRADTCGLRWRRSLPWLGWKERAVPPPPPRCFWLPQRSSQGCGRFKPGAATTWDGFAPVHYGGLSEHAVSLLAQLYTAVETVGAFPPCVAATSYVLIPKASGGQRPIGMLGSAYRLWA